ncbi:UNVERIFIED_CONTAM: hypothetical protein Sradi_5746300 [Sesamum radiatum]|uniref:Reverse transcriptase zinc-binding domain-containing protein n=1 Tax=Sesamum radiatum TaxID=300843 RepID=A0AAW2L2H1_SESRA
MNTSSWNENLIHEEFATIDAECILSIAVSTEQGQDDIIWHYGKQGKFSVSSAYSLACQIVTEATPFGNQRSWSFIWKLDLAPKIKLFLWKAYFRALPTLANLNKRGLRLEGGCVLCDADEEDTMHILVECPFARLVWAVSGVERRLIETNTKNVEAWMRGIRWNTDRGKFEGVAKICWSLRYNRNKQVFEGKGLNAVEVVEMAKCYGLLTNHNRVWDQG